ncbi:hypothetical protein MMC07_003198 [Pseudocyphellaria aurata]|nr:hypothetical protein [Pseudocyphellaria aurata]
MATNFPLAGFTSARASYPPVAESHPYPMGYIEDFNGVDYSREIGRSCKFGDDYYYVFGDTFCKDRHGAFVGITNNTIAKVRNVKFPIDTQYVEIESDGVVKMFLPLTEDELLLENSGVRVVLWTYGGIVETADEVGFIWYEKMVIYANDHRNYHGVGIARISKAKNDDSQLGVFRLDSMLFGTDEPRMGTFSALYHENFIYLWGEFKNQILLARVHKFFPTSRHGYRFWNGRAYVPDWKEAIPIFHDIQNGSFFRTSLFGPDRPWCFVGNNRFRDSIMMMGAEASLEGPWTLTPLFQAEGIRYLDDFRFGMQGHPWAYDGRKGELLVTWCETWPGAVIGAKVKLLMGK